MPIVGPSLPVVAHGFGKVDEFPHIIEEGRWAYTATTIVLDAIDTACQDAAAASATAPRPFTFRSFCNEQLSPGTAVRTEIRR